MHFCSAMFSLGAVSNMTAMDAKYEYEYLIKYKNLSYLHIQWLSGSELGTLHLQLFFPSASDNLIVYYMFFSSLLTEAMNQKSKAALNRYLTRVDKGEPQEEDIEPR